ncbi:MAG: lactonase family protein [Lachnospiraceae bacterium]|jgi:6-phosphogluconolactonase|nr:lactonase family protein [Lachnospiraceae bacterium]
MSAVSYNASPDQEVTFLVSGYGKKNQPSLGMFRGDPAKGRMKTLWTLDTLFSPSYMALAGEGDRRFLYTFEKDLPGGAVLAFEVTEKGASLLSRSASDYLGPCHISVSDRGDMVYTASYGKGSLSAFEIEEDGSLEPLSTFLHEGESAHPIRQNRAHVHFAAERDGTLFVVDLGQDKVMLYQTDHAAKEIIPTDDEICFPQGSGPRHLVFDPLHRDRLYVLSELTAEIFLCRKKKGVWMIEETFDALPGFASAPELKVPSTADPLSIGAAIKMSEDGKFLFVSCRLGFQCIVCFRVEEDGYLRFSDLAPSGGITPRDFVIAGDRLFIANQDSDRVSQILVDRERGKLHPAGPVLPFLAPTCLTLW